MTTLTTLTALTTLTTWSGHNQLQVQHVPPLWGSLYQGLSCPLRLQVLPCLWERSLFRIHHWKALVERLFQGREVFEHLLDPPSLPPGSSSHSPGRTWWEGLSKARSSKLISPCWPVQWTQPAGCSGNLHLDLRACGSVGLDMLCFIQGEPAEMKNPICSNTPILVNHT